MVINLEVLNTNNSRSEFNFKKLEIMALELNYNSKEEMLNFADSLKDHIEILMNQLVSIQDRFALVHYGQCITCSGNDAEKASLFIKNAKYSIGVADLKGLRKNLMIDTNIEFKNVSFFTKHFKGILMNQFLDEKWSNEFVEILMNLNEINLYYQCILKNKYKVLKY